MFTTHADTQKAPQVRIYAPQVFHYVIKNNDIMEACNTGNELLRDVLNAILYPFNR